MAYALG